MTSAGFGALRLVGEGEIAAIKRLYLEYLRGEIRRLGPKRVEELGSATLLVASTAGGFDSFLAGRFAQSGIAPLFTDAGRLKVDEGCMISRSAAGSDALYLVDHTCANSRGDSGGPIIDSHGRVTALMSRGRDSFGANEAVSQATRVDLFNIRARELIR
jgi:hypothetical protein